MILSISHFYLNGMEPMINCKPHSLDLQQFAPDVCITPSGIRLKPYEPLPYTEGG